MKYTYGLFSLFLLAGCGSYENDKIDVEGMNEKNKLLIPPVISKTSPSIEKKHNVEPQSDKEVEHEICLPNGK